MANSFSILGAASIDQLVLAEGNLRIESDKIESA